MSNLSVAKFERQVVSGDFQGATDTLTGILLGLEASQLNMVTDHGEEGEFFRRQGYTRLAAAISALVCNPNFVVDPPKFEYLMMHKRTISAIFGATTFGSMEHIISMCSELKDDQLRFSSESNIYKSLFAWTLEVNVEVLGNLLKQVPTTPRVLVWQSLLDRDYHLTLDIEQKRQQALALAPLVQGLSVPERFLVRLVNIWMFCSYSMAGDKHQVKVVLNDILRNTMKEVGVKQPPSYQRSVDSSKPKLAVLSEYFTTRHAMYRCYSDPIRQLKSHFDLIFVGTEGSIDSESHEIFDQVVTFPADTPIKKVIGKIVKLKPDAIYYPSIGMRIWTIAACQLRLAPIQFMTVGHPATTMSEFIDYVLVPEHFMGDPDCFSETVVLLEKEAIPFTPHPETEELGSAPTNQTQSMRGPIKIAVPSKGHKLNSVFLDCCETISKRTKADVEFHFFPNIGEAPMLQLAARLERRFPCKFHLPMQYPEYMALVGECDIQLSPFPFGNTNGYVDGLLMGVPIVSMDGVEVHSRIDNALGRMAKLPEFCLAKNPDEYVEAVIQLVDDEGLRFEVEEKIKGIDVNETFFYSDSTNLFSEAIRWIYRNHDEIQVRDQAVWSLEDRRSLA